MFIRLILMVCYIGCAVSTESIYDIVVDGIKCDCDRPTDLDVSEVKVYVYNFETNSNASYSITEASESITSRDDFDLTQCIHIFIPGFRNDINAEAADAARCTFGSGCTCNGKKFLLIIPDHSAYTSGNLLQEIKFIDLYRKAVKYTTSIAIAIGKLMAVLTKAVRDSGQVTASGHSLGGQMVGKAAETCKESGTSVDIILAMDPAGPCFKECPKDHVKSSQAKMVTAIHCNAGELGSYLNLTDYDAYANNGVTQDGCHKILREIASPCSHNKCVAIGMQTILESGIKAVETGSYQEYKEISNGDSQITYILYSEKSSAPKGVYFFGITNNDLECRK